jgi:hypothetical protein
MNEMILILYLERLLDRLYSEITKADDALGPDVERCKLEPRLISDLEKATTEAFNNVFGEIDEKEDEPIVDFGPSFGSSTALDDLRIFADSLSADIDDLRAIAFPQED